MSQHTGNGINAFMIDMMLYLYFMLCMLKFNEMKVWEISMLKGLPLKGLLMHLTVLLMFRSLDTLTRVQGYSWKITRKSFQN